MSGSLLLNHKSQNQANKIVEQLKKSGLTQQQLNLELLETAQRNFLDILNTINTLDKHPILKRPEYNERVAIQEGSMRLLHFGKYSNKNTPPLIFIPSLINRSYILDLSEENSFIKFLENNKINCYLIDWQEPDASEMGFNIDDYITKRINKVIDYVFAKNKQKVVLAGHCMGGTMSLAAYFNNRNKVLSLAFFATPWNFHSENFPRIDLDHLSINNLHQLIEKSEKISPDIIQSIFYYMHFSAITRKFENVSQLIKNGKNIELLAQREHWANDGISMTTKTATTCLIDWVHRNLTFKNEWRVLDKKISPALVDIPTFFAIAKKDHITPSDSALALYNSIKSNKTLIQPNSGHAAMIAGSKAKNQTWNPFLKWLKNAN